MLPRLAEADKPITPKSIENMWWMCMHILVAENDKGCRDTLVTVLSRYGEIHLAVNGEEAVLSFIRNHESGKPYNFICLNQTEPTMDALQPLRQIRRYEAEHGTAKSGSPICIISETPDCKKIFTHSLGDDPGTFFLPKPINIFELLSIFKESQLTRSKPTVLAAPALPRKGKPFAIYA